MSAGKEIQDIHYDSEKLTLQLSNGKKESVSFSEISKINRVFGKLEPAGVNVLAKVFVYIVGWFIDNPPGGFEGKKGLREVKIVLVNGKIIDLLIPNKNNQAITLKVNKLCHEKGWG